MLFRVSFKTLKNEVQSKFLLCWLLFLYSTLLEDEEKKRKDETISRFNTVVKTRDREDNHLEGNLFCVVIICSYDFFSFLQIIFIVVVFPVIFQ